MKKAVKCPNCNTYFDVDNIYDEKETTIYCNCGNCKFPLRIKTSYTVITEIISLLSDKCYFNEVRNHFIGYNSFIKPPNKPPMNYNF